MSQKWGPPPNQPWSGAPPDPNAQTYGQQQPQWSAPAPQPESWAGQSGPTQWGAPPPPQPQQWGAPPPPPPQAQQWGAPPPPPQAQQWGAPPPPPNAQPWGAVPPPPPGQQWGGPPPPNDAASAHARLMQQQAAMDAASRQAKKSSAGTDMVIGLILCVVGIAITVGTYDSASRSGGGTYFIAYGPIIYGAIRFFKGLVNLGG